MKHNMGKVERILRIVAGIPLALFSLIILNGFGILYGVVTPVTLAGFVLTVVGLIFFTTGLTGNCLLYTVFNFNTCKLCREGEHTHA